MNQGAGCKSYALRSGVSVRPPFTSCPRSVHLQSHTLARVHRRPSAIAIPGEQPTRGLVLTLPYCLAQTGAMSSEHFNTAGRNVKTGLTASVIVSQWTWAATLLQSSNQAWLYGISGPFWYAAGASIQVLLFGVLAIEVKRKASNAHTFLEMVDVRWGK
eukprot:4900466-Prymnesium_polylepis.1